VTKKVKAALEAAATNPPQPPEVTIQPRKYKQRKVTPKGLEKYHREMYFENLSPMLEAAFPALIDRARGGDMKAIQIIFEMCNYLKPQGTVSVINQIYNKNQAAAVSNGSNGDTPGGIQSFESILRRLEQSERVIDVTAQ
jgi:hypothetical protein